MLNRVPPYLKNKYSITIIVFLVWVLFFDQNNIFYQWDNYQELRSIREENEFYRIEIEKSTNRFKELTTNPKTLEKFAREHYFMKRDNEEVFVIVEE